MVTSKLCRIMRAHAERYPGMQVQDMYKLILQAALGSEHAVSDEASAREWLEQELSGLGPGPDEPLIDPVSPDGRFVRVHLRPYVQAGRDTQVLLKAFVDSSRASTGSPARMRTYIHKAVRQCAQDSFGIDKREMETFFTDMESRDFPAVHHSETYRRLYRPAYRLVAADLIRELT